MMDKAFWEKWTKCRVPYKVMKYLCGCKYVFVTDKEGLPVGRYSFCPEHKKAKIWIKLWCETCGAEIKAKPNAGYRQKRCSECTKGFCREYNRINYKPRYAGLYKQKPKEQVTELQELKKKDKTVEDIRYLAVSRLISGMKLDLPVVETPVLDRLLKE